MSFRDEFLEYLCQYERAFVQLQVICIVLFMILTFSWLVARPEPGTQRHAIILFDVVIVGIPLLGVSVLRRFCRQRSSSTLRDFRGFDR